MSVIWQIKCFVSIYNAGHDARIVGFITILTLLMNLHEIQMSVIWQIKCFVSIYNAGHDARIVYNLGIFILDCSLACT